MVLKGWYHTNPQADRQNLQCHLVTNNSHHTSCSRQKYKLKGTCQILYRQRVDQFNQQPDKEVHQYLTFTHCLGACWMERQQYSIPADCHGGRLRQSQSLHLKAQSRKKIYRRKKKKLVECKILKRIQCPVRRFSDEQMPKNDIVQLAICSLPERTLNLDVLYFCFVLLYSYTTQREGSHEVCST